MATIVTTKTFRRLDYNTKYQIKVRVRWGDYRGDWSEPFVYKTIKKNAIPRPWNVNLWFTKERDKRWAAVIRGDEVVMPNCSDSVDEYIVQLWRWDPDTNSRPDGEFYRKVRVKARDEDNNDTFKVKVPRVRKKDWYVARVRAVVDGERGPWSLWTDPESPKPGYDPTAPRNVEAWCKTARRIKITWDEPEEAEDLDEYKVEIYVGNNVRETIYTRDRWYRYAVPEEDRGKTHYAKVYTVDIDGDESTGTQSNSVTEVGDGPTTGCSKFPDIPTGVSIDFDQTETKTHAVWSAKVSWNEVQTDDTGSDIEIDRYAVQMIATDQNGNPIETQDGFVRLRERRKQPVNKVNITAATSAANVATFTTERKHGFYVDDNIVVSGVIPTNYNGSLVVASVPTSTTFTANISSTPADATEFGVVKDADDSLHVIFNKVPRPLKWYWKARVRAWDVAGCQGGWSAWTSPPKLPGAGTEEKPPPPTITGMTFDKRGGGRNNRLRCIVSWNEVENWEPTKGDKEVEMDRYVVQLHFNDGDGWDEHTKKKISAKDDDSDTTRNTRFGRIKRSNSYRVRIRSIDKYNRKGSWSDWYPSTSGTTVSATGAGPAALTNVEPLTGNVRRAGIKWTVPLVNNLPDDSVNMVHVQVSKDAGFSNIVDEAYKNPGKGSHRYAIPKNQQDQTHYVRVRSLDEAGATSSVGWQPGTTGAGMVGDPDPTTEDPPAGSINDLSQFTASLRPIAIVTELPPLPNIKYPEGSVVFLNSTEPGQGRLYRNVNNVWTDAISPDQLDSQITAGQIAANAILAHHIQAGQIDAAKLASTLLLTNRIVLDSGSLGVGRIQTAESGNRIEMVASAEADRIKFISGSTTALVATAGGVQIGSNANQQVGFFGASPIPKRSAITGRRSAELQNIVQQLLNALQAYGLITNSTTVS